MASPVTALLRSRLRERRSRGRPRARGRPQGQGRMRRGRVRVRRGRDRVRRDRVRRDRVGRGRVRRGRDRERRPPPAPGRQPPSALAGRRNPYSQRLADALGSVNGVCRGCGHRRIRLLPVVGRGGGADALDALRATIGSHLGGHGRRARCGVRGPARRPARGAAARRQLSGQPVGAPRAGRAPGHRPVRGRLVAGRRRTGRSAGPGSTDRPDLGTGRHLPRR